MSKERYLKRDTKSAIKVNRSGVRSYILIILCILIYLSTLIIGYIGYNDLSTRLYDLNNSINDIWGTDAQVQTVKDTIVGVQFDCPKEWVLERYNDASQVVLFETLAHYNNQDSYYGYSVTSSYVDKDFNLDAFVNDIYSSMNSNDNVASAQLSTIEIGGKKVKQIQTVQDGAFGGIIYLKNDNTIVEVLYCTQDRDDLEHYENNVSKLIQSIKFSTVKKEDFPEVSLNESDTESSVEKSESSYDVSVSIGEKSDNSETSVAE